MGRTILALCLAFLVSSRAQEQAFNVQTVIAEPFSHLDAPQWWEGTVDWQVAVTTSQEGAQRHYLQGMALIHSGWDAEAYRHFCEAVKLDPDFMMGYWGIAFSLIQPSQEVVEIRLAAIERMFDLAEAGFGTERERDLVRALGFLFSDDRDKAPAEFEKVARKYPNDFQTSLMASFLKKDGYDSLLGAGMGQREALDEIELQLRKNPKSQMALLFWVSLHAENPDGPGEVRSEVLPRARLLVEQVPDFPPYRHLLGHFEWRSGNLHLAAKEFETAISLYKEAIKRAGVDFHDCPNLLRSQLYLASVYFSLAEFEKALAVSRELSALKVDESRIESHGATLALWEGKTLAARLFLGRGYKGDFKKGLATLPSKAEGKKLLPKTPAVVAWEGWSHLLAAKNALVSGNEQDARKYTDALALADQLLGELAENVISRSCRQQWARARQGLANEWLRLRGEIAMKDHSKADRAAFWYESAVDREHVLAGFLPPILMTSAQLELAEFQAAHGLNEAAKESFRSALRGLPNNVFILERYINWLKKLGKTSDVAELTEHIKMLKDAQ